MLRIILASSSPRREELLTDLLGEGGFEIIPSVFDEENGHTKDPVFQAVRNAQGKAREVAGRVKEGIVIGVDTFVYLEGKVLGKPKDAEDAHRILRLQSGKDITVISGLSLIDAATGQEVTGSEETQVRIKELTDEEIETYVATGEALDKAGAFGVQGKGALFVERIEGDYSNIVGMPLFRLAVMAKTLGVDFLKNP